MFAAVENLSSCLCIKCLLLTTITASHHFGLFTFLPPDGLKCELLGNIITDCESNVVTGLDSSNSLPDGDRCLYCFISPFEMLGKSISIKSTVFSLLQVHPAVGLSPLLFYF